MFFGLIRNSFAYANVENFVKKDSPDENVGFNGRGLDSMYQ